MGIFPTEASQEWDGLRAMGTEGHSSGAGDRGIRPERALSETAAGVVQAGTPGPPLARDPGPLPRLGLGGDAPADPRRGGRAAVRGPFSDRFPTLAALASAPEDEVLAAWSGLGYYRRARHLHASAGQILRDHEGRFPRDRADALRLPGVGAYIAHAVLSIAYDAPLAVVDGNVVRVLSRLGDDRRPFARGPSEGSRSSPRSRPPGTQIRR